MTLLRISGNSPGTLEYFGPVKGFDQLFVFFFNHCNLRIAENVTFPSEQILLDIEWIILSQVYYLHYYLYLAYG